MHTDIDRRTPTWKAIEAWALEQQAQQTAVLCNEQSSLEAPRVAAARREIAVLHRLLTLGLPETEIET